MKNLYEAMNEANCFIGKGDYLHAAQRFLEALRINPDFAWNSLCIQTPWAFYAELLPTLKANFQKLHMRSRIVCINTMLELGQAKDALVFIPKLKSILPEGDPLLHEFYARAHAALGHYYTALQHVSCIEATMPNTGQYYDEKYSPQVTLQFFKLLCYFELGEDDQFEALIDEMLSADPQADLYLWKSFWLRDIGKFEDGLAAAEKALKIRKSSKAFFQRGWFKRALGDPCAEDDFRAFLAMPADPEKEYYTPFIYSYLGQKTRARQSMMEYFAAYSDRYQSYYLTAEIFSLLGDIPMAMESLEQAFNRGLVSRAGLYADPALQPVRNTEPGAALIRNRLKKLEDEDLHASREMTHCF